MKLKVFTDSLENLRDYYLAETEKIEIIEKAFGSGSFLEIEQLGNFIDKSIDIIAEDMKDEDNIIEWLFWEVMLESEGPTIFIENHMEYDATPENVWLSLKNRLVKTEETPSMQKESNGNDLINEIKQEVEYIININKTLDIDYRVLEVYDILDKKRENGIIESFKIARNITAKGQKYNINIKLKNIPEMFTITYIYE